jgi:hypothetical protein
MRAAALSAEAWMTDSTWASVPTGQPRTGWPEAMVERYPVPVLGDRVNF